MLDQLFSLENFRDIYDEVNRKGHDLGRSYFSQLKDDRTAIAEKSVELRALKGQKSFLSATDYNERFEHLIADINQLKLQKENTLLNCLKNIAAEANQPGFNVKLDSAVSTRGKPSYTLGEVAASFFVSKQVQKNLKRIYKVQPANRYEQVSRLLPYLGTSFPFQLVRTDISSFFESIPTDRITKKLADDRILADSSMNIIRSIIKQYKNLSGELRGIPRGVGISSYLAEIYLRTVDEQIKNLDGVCLYLRYVDDIVVIAAFSPYSGAVDLKALIKTILSRHQLSMNEGKTSTHDLSHRKQQDFTFLGYRFFDDGGGWKISPSHDRLARYEARLTSSFSAYNEEKSSNSRKAYRILVARTRFLTGNTRLTNSKSQALTGIYYNNSQVSHTAFLDQLDASLRRKIKAIPNRKLRARLSVYSFKKGFEERQFRHFSARELSQIVEAWKHVA